MRSGAVVVGFSILALLACKKVDPAEQRKLLASPDQKQRDQAAEALRKLYKADPKSAGETPVETWTAKVAALPDAAEAQQKALLATPLTATSLDDYRLDDYWAFSVKRDASRKKIVSVTPPFRSIAFVPVKPPDGFTGTWITYYVNGNVRENDEYAGGKLQHMKEMFDTGLPRREGNMTEGAKPGTSVPSGLVVTRYEDGRPEIEESYERGRLNGPRKLYYPSGKLKQEGSFVDGNPDGLLRNFREDGSDEWCIYYDKGREVDRACPIKR